MTPEITKKSADLYNRVVATAMAEIALSDARRDQYEHPERIAPAASDHRQAQAAMTECMGELVALHVDVLRNASTST